MSHVTSPDLMAWLTHWVNHMKDLGTKFKRAVLSSSLKANMLLYDKAEILQMC